MRHIKKIFTALILWFFAFAPPGTLILIGIFALGFLGKTWFIVGIVAGSVLLSVYGYIYKDKLAENRCLKTFLRKFRK